MQQSQSKVFLVTCAIVVILLGIGVFAYKSYKAAKSQSFGENSTVNKQQTTTTTVGTGSTAAQLNDVDSELNSLKDDENAVDSGLNDSPDNLQ